MEVPLPQFRQWKKQRLEEHIDCSKKGGIDEDIVGLVALINGSRDYFTTSSCSGRHVCYVEASGPHGARCLEVDHIHGRATQTALCRLHASARTGMRITLVWKPYTPGVLLALSGLARL